MARHCRLVLSIVTIVATVPMLWAKPVAITNSGWTISADESLAQLTISHDGLGIVLQNVELNLRSTNILTPARAWTVETTGPNQLSVKTRNPRMLWVLELQANELHIFSSSAGAVLTGQAPASPQRMVVRLLDRQGMAVDWVGTGEVAVTYGGSYTHNLSYLPRRNPDCAYFSLGQVSAAGLHGLFDRASDIAIDFAEDATLSRSGQNPDMLDITIPVPGNTLVRTIPDYFTKNLGVPFYIPFDDSHFPAAPMVWSSWTSYYEQVKEEDLVRNTDWIATHLLPYGFQFVQLDDGYDRGAAGQHFWITNWDQQKFPHGPGWLANYIHSRGLRPGIWLVPNSYA
ncbi:MAG: hypothetical protein WCA47_14910, partial [Terriglobales bacterium]